MAAENLAVIKQTSECSDHWTSCAPSQQRQPNRSGGREQGLASAPAAAATSAWRPALRGRRQWGACRCGSREYPPCTLQCRWWQQKRLRGGGGSTALSTICFKVRCPLVSHIMQSRPHSLELIPLLLSDASRHCLTGHPLLQPQQAGSQGYQLLGDTLNVLQAGGRAGRQAGGRAGGRAGSSSRVQIGSTQRACWASGGTNSSNC